MGIDPKVWGPSAWNLIHTVAFNVRTIQDLNYAKHIVYSFLYILPCEMCRRNFDKHLVSLPFPNEIEDVAKWSYAIHRRISGDAYLWSTAKERWSGIRSVRVADIHTFLMCIAQTHPSARAIDAMYRDSLWNFVRALSYFVKGLPRIRRDDVTSRTLFKSWVKKIAT